VNVQGTPAAGSGGADNVARRHPYLFHMTDSSGLESIKRLGLLSTSALLDTYGITGHDRDAIESEWRNDSIPLSHPTYGNALIRDQKPMRPAALERPHRRVDTIRLVSAAEPQGLLLAE
jgi:hypothetical protein